MIEYIHDLLFNTIGMGMKFYKKICHLKINSNYFLYFILVASLVTTVFCWNYTRKQVDKQIQIEFENQANQIINVLEKRMDLYISSLYNLQGFFAGSISVERDEWTDFITTANIFERYPGISAFTYIEKVPRAKKTAFEKSVQNDKYINPQGYPDFKIFPETDKNEYYPIKYMEPRTDDREKALGFDMSSESNRLAAMEKSRDLNKAVVTNKIIILSTNKPAFIIYVPIYENHKNIATVKDRISSLKGFVASGFRPEEFFPTMLQNRSDAENISLEIFDGSDPDRLTEATLIYKYNQRQNSSNKDSLPRFTLIKNANVAEKTWIVRFTALPEFKLSEPTGLLPLIVLISGIDYSFLLFLILFLLTRTQTRALKMAENMVKEYKQHDKLHSHTRVEKLTTQNKKD